MSSFEEKTKGQLDKGEKVYGKVDIPFFKYFWQIGPLSSVGDEGIPNFLRKISVFKNFTDNELRKFSSNLHIRNFKPREAIFEHEDQGIGFYLVFSGSIEIWAKGNPDNSKNVLSYMDDDKNVIKEKFYHMTTLDKFDYFGELALFSENNKRLATAVANGPCTLLGFFRPDLEDLINEDAVLGAKFLQALSAVLANRLGLITDELQKIKVSEKELENQNSKPKD